ncbi:Na+/H+ antiporter NhaA [Microbacterium dauci]|uniref:Na(+)/H(+) antiporter NhaA n=1 Tax=Microbacterium dauci TaxID=3048008 RepID=A0ABT6ZBJ6_9MICO|nr:Na+/H+ antiporter NhaA [Microbacterium sp. LX3-4]MDJ1113371.1 Na+/H+ antiporter NhaA [Microbacterium sp. LX3-4]
MALLRSARFPALLLLIAAALGLILANSPVADAAFAAKGAYVGIPGVFTLSVGHWIADGLLAVFFFVAAVELQYELTNGQLNSPRKALQPIIAAAGGVLIPIAVYVAIAGSGETAAGWPIPTATDIAFALGVLAVFGKGLPSGLRVFLLALAILDDIVGILFIAVLFTSDVDLLMLGAAVVLLVVFRLLSAQLGGRGSRAIAVLMVVVAAAVWFFVHESGVHATIAGVALGLVMHQQPALRTRHALEPWVNAIVLPVFALAASLVAIPQVSPTDLSPAFWGVAVALPLGKIVGISLAGWLSMFLGGTKLPFGDVLAAGALGGIGFTVSLLMSELAFSDDAATRDQATLGVLAGSAISLLLAAGLVSWRSWHYRRLAPQTVSTPVAPAT